MMTFRTLFAAALLSTLSAAAPARQEAPPEDQDREPPAGAAAADESPPTPDVPENLNDPSLERALRDRPGDLADIAIDEEDWPAYGRTVAAQRFSPLTQITPDNVDELEKVWRYRTGDMPPPGYSDKWAPETTPLKIGDALYLCTATNSLVSLDAASGRERWRHDPHVPLDSIPYSASCRGVAYYTVPGAPRGADCKRRVIEGTLDARLIAVDADTGVPCDGFGNNGNVDLMEGMGETAPGFVAVTSPPTIINGVAVVGHQVLDGQKEDSPSGVVRGYDAETGELVWAWDLGAPERRGLPAEGETYTRGTPNAWTIFSGDPELGLVYVPMGNSAVDYYGANRTAPENEFNTSLVALDAETGEVVWKYQTVHYDVWDYDLGGQASLVDFPTEDGTVPALILPTKQGELFVLDRRTGEPVTAVEERPVPQGGVADERLADTQPFSVGMPTLAKDDLVERDMWGVTPIDQLWCRIQFHRANYEGRYTPPSTERHWIQYPGYNGGSDWGGVAVDPRRNLLIANYNDTPMRNRLVPREQAEEMGLSSALGEPGASSKSAGGVPQLGAPYAAKIAPWRVFTGVLCKQPPYGGITAIDLETRETVWDQPLGTAWRNGPFGIPSRLPIRIGTPNNGGAAVTASGLIFIAAATDNLIRAIDTETGEVLWEDRLPAGGQATPIVYEADGRQFLVIVAGGHHFMETPIGDYVVAYALPEEMVRQDL